MFDKVLKIIEEKDIVIPKLLFYNYKKLNITNDELVIIIYLINSNDEIYNPKEISDNLNIELVEVLTIMSLLTEKGIIKTSIENKGTKKAEVLDLKPLYEKLAFLVVNEKEEIDTSVYSIIENAFARSISPFEYELIDSWKNSGISDELITEALKEAVYNDVTNLKYIDGILKNWVKKGIKNKDDVEKNNKKFKERKQVKKDNFEYDWLNDEE